METNPFKRTIRNLWIAAAVCVAACVGLVAAGEDVWAASFLTLLACVYLGIGGLVVAAIALQLRGTARRYEALLRGEGVLVRWTLDDATWRRYRELDARERRARGRLALKLFLMCAALFLIAAVGVYLDDPGMLEASIAFVLHAAGFAFIGWMLRRSTLAAETGPPPTVIVGRDGMAIRGAYTPWNTFGIRLVSASVDAETHAVRVTYRVFMNDNEVEHDVLVPYPQGAEREAAQLVVDLLRPAPLGSAPQI